MTLEEIADALPNGFHNAQINSIRINYVKREVTLDLEIWVSDLSEENSDIYRLAELKLFHLFALIIESPEAGYDYHEEKPLRVDAGSDQESIVPLTQLPAPLPEGAFTYWFFVHDWNSFIHVAARHAEIVLH
jgi:hypothetical protein